MIIKVSSAKVNRLSKNIILESMFNPRGINHSRGSYQEPHGIIFQVIIYHRRTAAGKRITVRLADVNCTIITSNKIDITKYDKITKGM